jgi:DNA-binding MarR family transcriptional regulator/Cdc6-like AAA superfamily ATPase
MTNAKLLTAAQFFLTRELTTYEDELFSLLYHDVGGFASARANEIVNQGRRISIYGVRGVGKSTAMQGILWNALRTTKDERLLPVTVTVKGTKAASNMNELEDVFYRSVIAGIAQTSYFKRREPRLREAAARYAPWIAGKITETIGIIFPPLALASDLSARSVKWLVNKVKKPDIQSLITSRDLDVKQAADLLINRLTDEGLVPVFAIDELDKVSNDTLLSDFFDGNQSWFQAKRVVVALTYTFGESVREAVASSIRRLASVEMYPGIATDVDAERILRARIYVGLSQVEKDEKAALKAAQMILPTETAKAILNVSAPNAYLMLERAYDAVANALMSKAFQVLPEHVVKEEAEIRVPTGLQHLIIKELRKGRLSPTDMSERLDKSTPSIVRALGKMMMNNWITRVGAGKRAYYSLTARGEAAARRKERSAE